MQNFSITFSFMGLQDINWHPMSTILTKIKTQFDLKKVLLLSHGLSPFYAAQKEFFHRFPFCPCPFCFACPILFVLFFQVERNFFFAWETGVYYEVCHKMLELACSESPHCRTVFCPYAKMQERKCCKLQEVSIRKTSWLPEHHKL